MRSLITLLLLGLVNLSYGQLTYVKEITKELCSPEYHGRGYAFQGDVKAAKYIASEFEKLGVDMLEDSYLQEFTLDVNTFPGTMDVRMGEQLLTPGKDFIVDANSGSFKGTFSTLVIDTTVLKTQLLLEDIIRQVKESKDKAFLIDTRGLDSRRANAMKANLLGLSVYAPVVFLTQEKFMWSVGRKQYSHPIILLKSESYQDGEDFTVDIAAEFVKSYKAYNVIGQVKAKNKTKKTVVFTAHYDHLGRMGESTYFPGANDNASGTAMLISMAKYFKENPVDYNVIFIAFGGEEAGLVGSKYFVEHPMIKLNKIRFLLNLDIMGSGEEGITLVNGSVHSEEFDLMQKINSEDKLLSKINKRGPTQNSDHYFFSLKGVPSFFIYTMGPNKHYHDIFDTYDELSFKECTDITQLLIRFVESL